MGTRADFYVGRGETPEWIGSIAWDGDPDSVFAHDEPEHLPVVYKDEADWRGSVAEFLAARDDGTTPDQGWPWPWDTSDTTDCAYTYADGIWLAHGGAWHRLDINAPGYGGPYWDDENHVDVEPEGGEPLTWPNMAASRNAAPLGSKRSGVIVFGFGGA